MEENNKLFVFERKEILLIFVFIIMIIAISFTLGVKTGKKLSLKNDGYVDSDIATIDLKSIDEEQVDKTAQAGTLSESLTDQDAIQERLKEEMKKLSSDEAKAPEKEIEAEEPEQIVESPAQEKTAQEEDLYNQNKVLKGKYTIQLYSSQSEDSAKDFADAFIAKGYDVIIHEIAIAGKGKWFRVSIGVFDNIGQAKDYLDKEKALFQNNKYFISQF